MFSHLVIFWTDPAQADAAGRLVAGANALLKSIPGVLALHAGTRVPSDRPIVEQSFQVALNVVFADQAAHDAYQTHPAHVEYVAKYVRPLAKKILVYDFA
jgi:hypothetical protein